MDALSRTLPSREQDSKSLKALLQLLHFKGFKISKDHKKIIKRTFTNTNPDESTEASDGSRDKSLISDSGAGHNNDVDILSIAKDYVNSRISSGKTPLHLSAEIGDAEFVDIFLTAGANVNAENIYKKTPLHLCTLFGHKHIVEVLFISGANVDAEDINQQTPLHYSANEGHKDIVEVLLKAGANIDAKDVWQRTPLHLSANEGHKDIVEVLLKAGANIGAKDVWQRTPLHLSANEGHKDIVEVLLKAGANIGAEDIIKRTPLHFSALGEHKDIVEILLKCGANVDAGNRVKQTPLHLSALLGHKDIVEILLKYGATVDAQDDDHETPLYSSVVRNHDDVTEILLNAGASVKKKYIHGTSVLDIMDERQKIKFGLKPVSKLLWIRNWIYSVTNSVQAVQSSESTEIEHTETVRATFTASGSSNISCEDSTSNNGQGHSSKDSSTLLMSESLQSGSTVISSGPMPLCPSSTSAESHDIDNNDFQVMNNLTEKLLVRIAEVSEEQGEGWEARCSNDMKAELQSGRIVIRPTIKFKQIKKIYINGPGTNLNITNAEAVAPQGQVVVHKTSKSVNDEEDDEDSSSEDETNNNV